MNLTNISIINKLKLRNSVITLLIVTLLIIKIIVINRRNKIHDFNNSINIQIIVNNFNDNYFKISVIKIMFIITINITHSVKILTINKINLITISSTTINLIIINNRVTLKINKINLIIKINIQTLLNRRFY